MAVEHGTVPTPSESQVLLRMQYSPVNPSDLYFVKGIYGDRKPLPVTPGFEGVGLVESWGGDTSRHRGELACVGWE